MSQGGYLTQRDFDREPTTFSFNTGAVTAVSLPGLLTQFGALRAAVEGITRGVMAKEGLSVFDTPLDGTAPTDPNAQREIKWLIHFEDVTQFFDPPVNAIPNAGYRKPFTAEIGCADPQESAPGVPRMLLNQRYADLTNPTIDAFVDAFEAIAKSPYGGSIKVLSIELVGRNI